MNIKLLLLLLTLAPSFSVLAELKTITLSVDKMTCGTCPLTVRRALRKIEGVESVKSKYLGNGDGWAKVTYDTDKADVDDLTFATEMAGYPSHLKE